MLKFHLLESAGLVPSCGLLIPYSVPQWELQIVYNLGLYLANLQIGLISYKVKVKVKSLSHVQLFVTPWTVAYESSLSTGFSSQEYWSKIDSDV